jgi:hypothetical protein
LEETLEPVQVLRRQRQAIHRLHHLILHLRYEVQNKQLQMDKQRLLREILQRMDVRRIDLNLQSLLQSLHNRVSNN